MIDIPGYKILRQLGRGGMATVYLAVQALVEREVALKVMAPQLSVDPSFGERFLREARIAARLRHPHIVAVIEVGVHGDLHYAAMEYLSGGPILKRDGDSLELSAALRAVREIAQALDYAHGKGVVHRDVKPDNIFLREDGSAVLGDFGIARAVDASGAVTRTGAVVGTPVYMSPEQLRGKSVDGRSDLYSLGVVFHQLLLGHPPYVADDALALGIMHMTSPLPQLPGALAMAQPLLSRLLAKEPDDRFQNGAEVVHAVLRLEAELQAGTQVPTEQLPMYARDEREQQGHGRQDGPVFGATDPLDADRGRRADPSFGEMHEAVSERWRLTPRPAGRQTRHGRRWFWPAALLLLGLGSALAWQQRAAWLPQAQAQIAGWLQQEDPRLSQFERLKTEGRLLSPSGDDALARLAALLADDPQDTRALAALAGSWPTLLGELARLKREDPQAAQALRQRLIAIRPDAPELRETAGGATDAGTVTTSAGAVATSAGAGTASVTNDSAAQARLEQAQTALAAARRAERELRWHGEDGAVRLYANALALNPADPAATDGLARLIDRILIDAREALQQRADPLPAAAAVASFERLSQAESARKELQRLLDLAERRSQGADRAQRIRESLQEADRLLARSRPGEVELQQIGERLSAALLLDPGDPRLRETVDKLVAILILRAAEQAEAGNTEATERLLAQIRLLAPDSAQLRELQIRVEGGNGGS
jgi:hypothetical protein